MQQEVKLTHILRTLGAEGASFDYDCKILTFHCTAAEIYANEFGSMAGGILAALLDNGMGKLVSVLYNLNVVASLSLSVQYISQAKIGERLRIEVWHIGGNERNSLVEGRVMCGDKVIAQAQGTFSHPHPKDRKHS